VPRPPAVYAIADAATLAPRTLDEAAEAMAAAGIRWIQFRAKTLPDRVLFHGVESALRRLEGADVELWIDDRVDVGALFDLQGVHLGQDDLPAAAARPLLRPSQWLGMSTHDLDQLRRADADPEVDLLAFGPVFATRSKASPDPVVGLDGLAEACRIARKPVVGIGGIDADNLPHVLAAGASSAAVIGAVCRGPDIGGNCRRLLAALGACAGNGIAPSSNIASGGNATRHSRS
jgi:thiamine-phosphate pyrophosphorylase